MRKLFLALSFLAGLTGAALAQAQVAPAVQQASTRSDAATNVCPFAATPVAVNQQETVTCTPPAGQFVYITGLSFEVCTNGTGTAANQVTWTTTNLTGAPVFSFSVAATASICQRWQEPLTTPLKSTVAGTAVTFVSPVAATNNSYHLRAYVYFAP